MFSELVSQLSDAPESEWIVSFKALVRSVESSGSSSKVPSKRDISQVFTLIESQLSRTASGGSEELISVLLDALRVLLRFRENVEAALTAQLMSHLLNISEDSAIGYVDKAQLAARCLINFLFDNAQNAMVFLSVEVDGLSRIVRILNRHCEWCNARTEELSNLHYFLVRAVHMMVSQNDYVRAQLSPSSELTSSLVASLIRRLSKTVATVDNGTTSTTIAGSGTRATGGAVASFPYGECNGKLYLEIGRLLFALECHEVLKTHNTSTTSTTTSTGANTSTSTGASGAAETGPLSIVLIVTVLSAVLSSTTPYSIPTTTTPTNTDSTTATTMTALSTLQQQCQDVSIQLAMYLPTRSYHDSSVVTELGALISSNSGGSAGSTGGDSKEDNSTTTDTTYEPAIVVQIVPFLLSILHRQLLQAHGESTDTSNSDSIRGGSNSSSSTSGSVKSVKAVIAMKPSEQSALLTPILVLLTKLCTHSLTARAATKNAIFPGVFDPTATTHLTRAGTAKMDPTDVPCGTMRYYLVGFMTSLDSQLKRCVAELVYVLCDEDADEFTARTGFGNAVALLQLKGLC